MEDAPPTTWILTGSPENFAATRDHGFRVVGMKERRHRQALEMVPGNRIILYLTRIAAFGASVVLTSDMYEDRTPLWPGKPGNPDAYPWRFDCVPELILDEERMLPAIEVRDDLEHIRKWPAEHWRLAFQGQLRTISPADADLLLGRMRQAAGVPA
ncbi:unannotated protein [freshwater metagenome]|uniref:Unannotated protein n=1 Tax=freshwater metagenome TaxID=449393 RepID=A0A6J7IYU9_9ZZZZ|nr:EVE domain-containing protein [Actinomycetota bacterium]